MCGRFTRTVDLQTVARRFGVHAMMDEGIASPPRYNIAPTQAVIVVGDDGQRFLIQMRWGLIPSWAKDPAIGNRMINARAETLAVKPAFRVALRKRRCLVVADGFYEWQQRGRGKQPVYIVLKTREPFSFAGLWETWTAPEGKEIKSCTIITTEANELLKPIHDRMPVILTREAEAIWLDPSIQEPVKALPLLKPYPSEEMEVYPVRRLVNSPNNDTPECIVPEKSDTRGAP
ncbi:MAG: SOS response-associated peptidase [Candidatus Methylomirabilis sp.]